MDKKIILLAVIVIAVISALFWMRNATTLSWREEKPSSPITATLTLSDKPLLNKQVTLTLEFSSIIKADNVTAIITLPSGFELVSGNLNWNGALMENEMNNLAAVVKCTTPGYYLLNATVVNLIPTEYGPAGFGSGARIYLEVSEHGVEYDSRPINNWLSAGDTVTARLIEENSQLIDTEILFSALPVVGQEIVITYHVTPSISLTEEQTSIALSYPQKGLELVKAEFPDWGTSSRYEGSLNWRGSLQINQTAEIKATYKVRSYGWGEVAGQVLIQQDREAPMSREDTLELYVDKYSSKATVAPRIVNS